MADPQPAVSSRAVYLDGRICTRDGAHVSIDDHGALYGLGFFETFRTSDGRPHLWPWHRRRLLHACEIAGIAVPATFLARDETTLLEAVRALLREQRLVDAVFRYTITAGQPAEAGRCGSELARDSSATSREQVAGCRFRSVRSHSFPSIRYDCPSELLSLRPLPAESASEGIALRVLALRRDNGEWLPRPKSLNFANALLGAHELQRRAAAADDEGLFLSRETSHVVETVRHNLAWIAGGRWFFPDPALGAVAGTGLQWLLDTVASFAAAPARATLDDLIRADAVVVINSVRGITPVRELWDESDRTRLGVWHSHAHPLVIDARRCWREALQSSAALPVLRRLGEGG